MVKLREEEILKTDGMHVAETILKDEAVTFRHTHDFYEMFLITSGQILHLINQKQIVMNCDTLCFVHPEDVHCFKKGDCQTAHFVNIAFSKELFQLAAQVYAIYGNTGGKEIITKQMTRLPAGLSQALLSRIVFLSKDSTNLYHISKKDVLVSIVLDGLSYLQERNEVEALAPVWLMNACECMQKKENYLQGLSRFIEISGKSQEHLTRMMRKCYNKTPSAYLNSIKLEEAAILLKTTGYSILEVLLECGFNNVSYFNNVFKSEYGITPARYRSLNRTVINPVRRKD